jgi:hypothetical protein
MKCCFCSFVMKLYFLCVCGFTCTITIRVFRLMNIETYAFCTLPLYNNLSERSRRNPEPDSFRFGGESLCGNLPSLAYVGFK